MSLATLVAVAWNPNGPRLQSRLGSWLSLACFKPPMTHRDSRAPYCGRARSPTKISPLGERRSTCQFGLPYWRVKINLQVSKEFEIHALGYITANIYLPLNKTQHIYSTTSATSSFEIKRAKNFVGRRLEIKPNTAFSEINSTTSVLSIVLLLRWYAGAFKTIGFEELALSMALNCYEDVTIGTAGAKWSTSGMGFLWPATIGEQVKTPIDCGILCDGQVGKSPSTFNCTCSRYNR